MQGLRALIRTGKAALKRTRFKATEHVRLLHQIKPTLARQPIKQQLRQSPLPNKWHIQASSHFRQRTTAQTARLFTTGIRPRAVPRSFADGGVGLQKARNFSSSSTVLDNAVSHVHLFWRALAEELSDLQGVDDRAPISNCLTYKKRAALPKTRFDYNVAKLKAPVSSQRSCAKKTASLASSEPWIREKLFERAGRAERADALCIVVPVAAELEYSLQSDREMVDLLFRETDKQKKRYYSLLKKLEDYEMVYTTSHFRLHGMLQLVVILEDGYTEMDVQAALGWPETEEAWYTVMPYGDLDYLETASDGAMTPSDDSYFTHQSRAVSLEDKQDGLLVMPLGDVSPDLLSPVLSSYSGFSSPFSVQQERWADEAATMILDADIHRLVGLFGFDHSRVDGQHYPQEYEEAREGTERKGISPRGLIEDIDAMPPLFR